MKFCDTTFTFDSSLFFSVICILYSYSTFIITRRKCNYPPLVRVARHELMALAKVWSKATYHKCIRELCQLGYIEYNPTYNSYIGTTFYLRTLSLEMSHL
jgi:hypothetical protein